MKILQLWISCVTLCLYESGSGFHCLHQFYFLSLGATAAKYPAPCDNTQGSEPVASDVAIKMQRALLLSAPYVVLLGVHLGADPATGPLFPRSDAASYWIGLHKRNLGTWVTAVHVTLAFDMNEVWREAAQWTACRACIAHRVHAELWAWISISVFHIHRTNHKYKVKIHEPKVQGTEMSTAMQQVKNCLVYWSSKCHHDIHGIPIFGSIHNLFLQDQF
jgi:hypothetical protein